MLPRMDPRPRDNTLEQIKLSLVIWAWRGAGLHALGSPSALNRGRAGGMGTVNAPPSLILAVEQHKAKKQQKRRDQHHNQELPVRAEPVGRDGWRHQVSLPFPNDDNDGSQEDNEDDEASSTDPQDEAHLLRVLRHLEGTLALFAGSCQGTRTGRRGQCLAPGWVAASHRKILVFP